MKKSLPISFAAVLAPASSAPVTAAPDSKALHSSKRAMCHEQDGVPKKMGAGSKVFGDPEFNASATVESIVASIYDGRGKMKPVKTPADDEVKAILSIAAAR